MAHTQTQPIAHINSIHFGNMLPLQLRNFVGILPLLPALPGPGSQPISVSCCSPLLLLPHRCAVAAGEAFVSAAAAADAAASREGAG